MQQIFNQILAEEPYKSVLNAHAPLAVAVSGGGDSMALCRLLIDWAQQHSRTLYVLSVDHGLRADSADEVQCVAKWVSDFSCVSHHILRWQSDKPDSGVQAKARQARYQLMAGFCAAHGVGALFLAHHADDQAETFVQRFIRGSGLQGLAAMRPVVAYSDDLLLLRPLLGVHKAELLDYLSSIGQDYIEDPSNQNDDFTRVRLRSFLDQLFGEGLSDKRLHVTASRLCRADEALDIYVDNIWFGSDCIVNNQHVYIACDVFTSAPEEVSLRLCLRCFSHFDPLRAYMPRMEKIEALCTALRVEDVMKKRTLGGLAFSKKKRGGKIVIEPEEWLASQGK